ncbi:HAD family hydrolase [Ruania alba]|uniref:Haloacid dehalogenase superfamily, subfamily IA, variant 3 with third motif having DD or ED n=1 Tax=Ruania alba TaxID=648782 RepID=A0A1H5ERM0_9MICO|nr:HAD family phosphatase [Ruania alba]SED93729.1 haloacid dehalogenase superfamily, subfamily IA, variant 3 with third motif having DD or ED [Ruania alba]
MTSPLPAGVLFDMDGTLVDTEPHWQAAQEALAASIGTTWTQADFEASIGRPMERWAEVLIARGVPGTLDQIIARAVAYVSDMMRAEMPWLPGAYELLEQLAADGIPCGLVTNNAGVNAALLADAAPAGSLQVLVSTDDVTSPKPHPEPYLTAIARLGIDPARSIAFEDSTSGATSAHEAGLGVWFINSHTADPGIPTARVIGSPAEVTVAEVRATLAGSHTAELA